MLTLRMIALALAMLLSVAGAAVFGAANAAAANGTHTPAAPAHTHVKHAKTHPTAEHVTRRQNHHGSGVAAHRHHARHARHARAHGQRRAQKRASHQSTRRADA
ncbi:MAG TPA: hypothetical protein VFI22_19155 [Thermomicrobiales bacterium]|nr:hypothetical protein [Thermomicrobiales bacterium]